MDSTVLSKSKLSLARFLPSLKRAEGAERTHSQTFEKVSYYVIPAKAGIQNQLKTLDSVSSTE